ncbi:tenascin-X isoform X3 [Carettochelys insculpta]|uniref:tenascin-X isoform X3 n=1 Tax=Carettochelys insculpta TaxID=44489 RepID=UPI003EBC510D
MGPWLLLSLLLLLVQGAPPSPSMGLPPPHSRRAAAPANTTVFSHIYSIRRAPQGARPPQEALAPRGQQQPHLYEHTLAGEDQVVFTHRINLPAPACDCEGGGDGAALREALSRLRALEAQVQVLREQCGAKGCCPLAASTQASTGPTDTPRLCSRRGTFHASNCSCVCEPGWGGPTCAEPRCPGGCGGRGQCEGGRCVCPPGWAGARCQTPVCPDDCNDQGRCVAGRCACFPGYAGPACERPLCPGDCGGRGECRDGRCHCRPGYAGPACTVEIPAMVLRVGHRDESSFRLQWNPPKSRVDGYEIRLVPTDDPQGTVTLQLPSSATSFERSGLGPGQQFSVTVRAQRDQHLGPPATQSVRTRMDAPRSLRPTGATATSLSLRWEPPAARPDGYTLRYGPAGQDSAKAPTQLALPPDSSTVTLSGLRSATRYTLTLTAHWGTEQSPPASASASTAPMPTLPPPRQPLPAPARPPAPHLRPPGPVGQPAPWPAAANASSLPSQRFLQTLPAQLSQYNGTLLQRLESYLRATGYPLRGNQTVPGVAWAIFLYLTRRKSLEEQQTVYQRLGEVGPTGPPGRLIGAASGAFAEGSGARPQGHAKPELAARSPDALLLSLAGVRGLSERVVVRYWRAGDGGGAGELVLPGDAATVRLQGLAPGTAYRVEIHGLLQGRLSKSYSLLFSTAPEASSSEQPPAPPQPSPSAPTSPLGDLAVSDVSPSRFLVSWMATPGTFQHFLLQYRKPGSPAPPQQTQVPGGQRSVAITQLSPGTEYEVELRGVAPDGTVSGPLTTSVSTVPLAEGPAAVELGGLGVRNVTSEGFGLQWRARKGLFQSFLLRYEEAAGRAGPQEVEMPAEQRAAHVQGLQPATEYNVTLYGVHRGQLSPPLRASVRTAPAEPTAQPSLGELSASDVTDSSIRLSWSVPAGDFDSFLLQYKDTEGKPHALPVAGGSRTVTVTSLAPSRRYKFNLYGVSGRKRLGPVSADAVTAAAPPKEGPTAQPSLGELSASDVTDSSIQLSWTVPAGDFDSFLLQYKDAEGKPQALPVAGGSRTVTVTSLAPSRRYKFNLYGVSGRKRLGPVSADTVTASASRQQEPTTQPSLGELSASDVTDSSVRLSWTVPAGDFDSFLLQYKDAEGKPQALPVAGGSRTVTVTSLAPSRRYKFNLYGVSGRKRLGPVSADAVTAPRQQEPTAQPSLGELSASDVTDSSVRLSWTVPAGDFDSFLLQYKDAEGKPQALPVAGGSRTVTVTSLAPSRRYKFNLYGVSGRKRLGPVSADAVTAAEPGKEEPTTQPSVGELSASDITHDSARLSWTVEEGTFNSFLLQYKDAEGKPQELPMDGGSRTVTVTSLAPSRRYKFNLYGVSGRKRLGPVSTDAVTAAEPRKEEPTTQPSLGELSASDITHDYARLSWTVEEGTFDSFLLQYKDAEGKPQALPVDGGSRTVTVTSLAPSRRYKFNLYGMSGRKRLGPVSADAVTAVEPRKEEPTTQPSLGELSASNITHDSARLSWTVEEGTFDSFLLQYKDAEGKPQALPVDGGSHTVTITNLAPSRRYKFNLYGVSGRKRLGPVSTDAVTAVEPRKEEPTTQPSLGELSASNITHDSARLSWTVEEGTFDSFLLQYKDAEGKPQALPVDGGSHTVTITNLAPSRRYKFNLYGVSGRKRLGPVSTDAVTAVEPRKEEPTTQPSLGELSVSNITHDSARLSWTVEEGTFDSFLLQYKDAEGKPQALPVDGGSRTGTVTSLAPSRRYKFNLYGVSGRKRLGPVSTDAVTASEPRKEEPTTQPSLGELSASDVTHDSTRLSWTVEEGTFDSFLLQYKDAEGKPQALPVAGGSRTVTVTSLAPSRRYKFNLYGVSGRKRLGPVSTDAVTAAEPRKEEPTTQPSLGGLSASNITHDSARLSWTVEEGTFDSFLLQYKDAEGKPQALPVDGGSRTVTVTSLAPSRRYKFNLYSVSGRKRLGPVSTDAVTAAEPRKEEPTTQPSLGELSASDITHDSARLSWTVEEGTFDSFLLQYKDAEGKPQALPVDGGSRTVTVTSLAPSRRYKFNLYGVSGRKRLGPVSADTVTAAEPRKEEPTTQPSLGELSASDITHDSARLSWTVEEGTFDSFLLQYKDAEGKPQALPVAGGSRTVTVTSLAPSRRYKFNLYGVSGRKRLGPVSADAVTAAVRREQEPTAQPSLGELSASNVTDSSIRLSWTVPAGDFDSFLLQYKDAEGKPQALPVAGGSRTVTVTSLVPSRRYKFNLYGVYGRKRLGPVSADAVTAAAPQEEGTGTGTGTRLRLGQLSADKIAHDSLDLSWGVEEGTFDSFILQYRDADGTAQALPVAGVLRSLHLHDLAPTRRYKFNLYGVSGRKRLGPVSAEAVTAAAPQEEEPTAQPSVGELSASDITHDSARLSWTVEEGTFDSFLLQYKDAEGKPQELPMDGGSRTVTVTSLAPSCRYKFNLYGVSGRKRLGPVSTDAVTAAEPRKEETTTQPRLGELSASDTTHDSARLSWTVEEGTFDSFLLQYKDAEGKPQALPVDGGSRTVTVTSLAPSRRYKFNLYGVSGRKRLGPVSTDAVTAGEPKEEPTAQPRLGELSASNTTHDSARLSWTVEEGTFDSFLLQYKDAEGKPQALPVAGGSRTVTVTSLAPSRRYKFNLYGVSGRKRLGPVSADTVTAAAPREQEPTAQPSLGELSASDVTHDSIRLSWTVEEGTFDSFLLQYKDAEGKPQALPVDGGSRTVTVTSLAPSRRYKFNLYGVSGRKRLGPVSTDAVTAAAPRQQEPTAQPSLGELSASDVTDSSIRLSWSVLAGDFDSFLLQYKDAEGKPQALPVAGGSRTVTVTSLAPSRRYKFNLYGVSGHKRLGPVSADAVTATALRKEEPTAQPSLGELSASDVTDSSVRLSWTVEEGTFDSFLLQYKDAEGKPQALPVAGGSRTVTVTSLAPSRRYKFNLYGVSGRKRLGPVSADAVTATAPRQQEPTAQPSLGELSASDVTDSSIRLSWSVPAGDFDSFLLQYKDAEGKPQALPVAGGSRTVTVTSLAPSRRYKFNLYGVSGRKRLGPVSADAVTAAAPREEPTGTQLRLGGLSASDATHDSVDLSWTVEEGTFDSFLLQYKDADGNAQVLPVDGGSRTVTVTSLAPSRRYKFSLYGVSGRKRLGPVSADAVTGPTQEPEAEGGATQPWLGELSVSEVTKDSVRLSWTVPAGDFESFLLQYRDAEGKPQALPVAGGSRSLVVSDLLPSHKYNFNLYGLSGRRRLGPVSTDAVTAFPEASSLRLVRLGPLLVSEVTPTSLRLSWDVSPGDFDAFLLRYQVGAAPAQELQVPGAQHSAVLRGLQPGTEYGLALAGLRQGQEVADVRGVAQTSSLELESPQDLRFSDVRQTSVGVTWGPPPTRVDRYKVSFQLTDGGEPQSQLVRGAQLQTTLEGLSPGASYEVSVMAVRGFEESEPLVGYVTTVPNGPSDLRAVDITDTSALLRWRPPRGPAHSYELSYRPPQGPAVTLQLPGDRAEHPLSGLQRDTEYLVSLRAVRAGDHSSPASATFSTGLDAPRDLRASEVAPRSARLSWTPPRAPPAGYLLSYETPSGHAQAIHLGSDAASYLLSNLTPSSRYQVRLQAMRGGQPSTPLATSFNTVWLRYPFPRDCTEEQLNGPGPSGEVTIYLGGDRQRPLRVYCDMETDGGGWLVFQRRMDGETDFWRDWQDYARGFGNLSREFWLGNDALHQLTAAEEQELRVDLRAGAEAVYAQYQRFRVDSPTEYYRLHLEGYRGTAGDALSYHSGSAFSTRDRDPNRRLTPCAVSYHGAWWYHNCHYANLNGLYGSRRDHQGVNWFNWKGFEFSIPFTEMKLRPRQR